MIVALLGIVRSRFIGLRSSGGYCRVVSAVWLVGIIGAVGPSACGQTVRFDTNAGSFDVVLNPTANPLLQGHVDNFLQYVTSGRYDGTVINRAAPSFVLQMGLFKVASTAVPSMVSGFVPIDKFAPVIGVPAAQVGLSNTAGTVGLAIGATNGFYDRNSGTSSFYVNFASNSFLDGDFTVFAEIPDMTTMNAIMSLSKVDLLAVPGFGAQPGDFTFTDVPLLANGDLVVISHAFVVPEPSGCVAICMLLLVFWAPRRNPRETASGVTLSA